MAAPPDRGRSRFASRHVARRDRDPPVAGDGVACIDDQVGQDLVDLAGIGAHAPEVGAEVEDELDLLRDQPAQHLPRVAEELVQVEHPRLDRLPAREGQELAHQVGGALGGDQDLVEIHLRRILGVDPLLGALGVAEDDAQHVVEIVRDAAREPSDALHLLRLHELLLELQPGADVALHGHEVGDPTLFVEDRRDALFFRIERAVLPPVDEAPVPGATRGDGAPQVAVELRTLLAAVQEARALPERLLATVAGDRFEGRIGIVDRALAVGDENRLPGLIDRLPQQPELGLGPLALGDVLGQRDDNALAVESARKEANFLGKDLAAAAQAPELEALRLAGERARNRTPDFAQVVSAGGAEELRCVADEPLARMAVHPGRAVVDVEKATLGVLDVDCVRDALEAGCCSCSRSRAGPFPRAGDR